MYSIGDHDVLPGREPISSSILAMAESSTLSRLSRTTNKLSGSVAMDHLDCMSSLHCFA